MPTVRLLISAFAVWALRSVLPAASIASRFLGRLAKFQAPPSVILSHAKSPSIP